MHLIRFGLIGLLMASSSLVVHGRTRRAAPANLDLTQVSLQAPEIKFAVISTEPVVPKLTKSGAICGGVGNVSRVFTCGGLLPVSFFPKSSEPREAVEQLASAYRNCRAIRAYLLDPEVDLDDYPSGYFSSWVRDGVLVTDRTSLTTEDDMRRIFSLLVEAIGDSNGEEELWSDEPLADVSVAEYRRATGFFAVMSFDFVGTAPLRIDLGRRHILVHAGDKWAAYELDHESAEAIRKFLKTRMQ